MKPKNILTIVLTSMLVLLMSACSLQVDRNPDGSLQVEGAMTAADLQSEIDLALKDQDINQLNVQLQDGYIRVSGGHALAGSETTAELRFRLDLRAVDGAIAAQISEATLNGNPVDADRVEAWNARLSQRLERLSARHPNATLESVQVTPTEIKFNWQVETRYSRE